MFSSTKKEANLDMPPSAVPPGPVEEISSFVKQAEDGDKLKQKTVEERQQENKQTTTASFTTVLYRQFGMNKDIVLLILFGLLCMLFGYCLMFIRMSFSVDQIKVGLRDFFEIMLSLLAMAGTFVWRIYTPPGKFSKDLIRRANKDETKVDDWGRTIPGK